MHTGLLLEIAAEAAADRAAVGPLAGGWTFGELFSRARAGAHWFVDHPAETIAFIGTNGSAMPLALFASGLSGKPFAPLNYRLPDADLRRLLERTAPSVAIVDEDMVARVAGVPGVTIVARKAFEAQCEGGDHSECPLVEPDVAVLLFTSGTTGEPKVAVLRHHHIASYVMANVEFLGSEEDEAALVSVPPYHIAGISAALTGVYSGRRIVYLPQFTAESWVETAARERITQAMVVPTMLDRILDVLEERGEALPALRALSYGGGRMPLPVIERAMRLLPQVDFVNAYGLTETSSTITLLTPEDHRIAMASNDPVVHRRIASVGKPLPSVEIEIRDPETHERLPDGTPGEVYVRGDQIAGEYKHKSMLTADGWFPTNDCGWIDADGYLFLEGRLDDVIVRGGENISPGEIEDVLRAHPDVADVAVLGVPDTQWGEAVAAVIVPRDRSLGSDALGAWVRERLRSTKTPEHWRFRSELPYNDTGKLLRRVLKVEVTESL